MKGRDPDGIDSEYDRFEDRVWGVVDGETVGCKIIF